ncbi:MAG: hypothetical protein C4532_09345 [Candidatus Abyssobacteria bacterium SURF_17]|jgi:hypothetical protein|uniref:Uncharacterized protein n=1 Tax=Candidatus Abyssobacteria bacterium SURF_17 TaxID=2093361 RepID=A0A419EYJ8_9BACT|nr:MAG: hypothetical protein C4532_09345 [Candidatus Abyssubacteria bacterium SURF_17]
MHLFPRFIRLLRSMSAAVWAFLYASEQAKADIKDEISLNSSPCDLLVNNPTHAADVRSRHYSTAHFPIFPIKLTNIERLTKQLVSPMLSFQPVFVPSLLTPTSVRVLPDRDRVAVSEGLARNRFARILHRGKEE